jgi:hypothetical protein
MSGLTDRWGLRAIIRISEHTCSSGKAAGSCALGECIQCRVTSQVEVNALQDRQEALSAYISPTCSD